MTNPSITIYNGETGETIVREMNKEEYAEHLAITKQAQADKLARETLAETKATERAAILNRLGITAEEAALILG
jgi:hypothetical protein